MSASAMSQSNNQSSLSTSQFGAFGQPPPFGSFGQPPPFGAPAAPGLSGVSGSGTAFIPHNYS